eukprot:CAMPEP_0197632874 /NCGR_PEP_ID=MMETSP1338-20131121/9411_1 /TAXON_ID=43686 ORGANISM="Pelagodinium beii, Strain RCC1491" /NCGR_SAMPLE_ID=MMETSP1338 /ASSEMBLY_ACC=CAM_ASM_000754 /LENGTH=209 /DNA_ID=CAMNT_0043204447 /DNA_START=55 /DNA_END=680 /DNA_ORIENTATION=-
MSLAWLREAASANQKLASTAPDPSTWSRIDEIGGGLYICGAAALEDTATMQKLGIRSVLNCGEESLLHRSCNGGVTLREQLDGFRVEHLEAMDIEEQPMSAAWERGSTFIEESVRSGNGVVVHCQAGVSRSSSTCIAYLMTREGLPLESAFRRVFQARDYIRPNAGFWGQLKELEAQRAKVAPHLETPKTNDDAATRAMALLDAQLAQR